ncbi:MAG TPA: alpha/beta fold hydrolase [Actinospica sp.]|nr:alpha/beta fold hydrolase [Actinospica sp.]
MAGFSAYAETQHYVVSHDVRLAVFENVGDGPSLLFVHGYPDTHIVWDAVRAELAERFHTVRHDVRGAGASDSPRGVREYRLDRLADDLFAVADFVSPDLPVHIVAHDWGSIQSWHAVTDPRAVHRIASFTTISGPCLDHTGHWFRERFRRPTPRRLAQLLKQSAKSWYIYAFHIPFAAPLLWRFWLARNWGALLRRAEGIEPSPGHPQPTLEADAVRGIRLYRANMIRRLMKPQRRFTQVPVQIISPTKDRFVSPALAEGLEKWAPDLQRETVECGHWGALTQRASEVAALIAKFVTEVEEA